MSKDHDTTSSAPNGAGAGPAAAADSTPGPSGDSTPGIGGGRKLRRTQGNRMIAGVCSGAAEFLGVDANILRLGLAAFTIFGGAGIAIYALGWLLIPEEGHATSIAQDVITNFTDKSRS